MKKRASYLAGFNRIGSCILRDGKLYSSVISDGYRAALEYLRDIYAEGLIYPEIFTMTSTQRYEEWVRGTFGVTTWWWTYAANSVNRYGFFEANPDGGIAFFDPVTGPDGYAGHIAEDDISNVVAISAKSEHVDKALELINFQATYYGYLVVYSGVEDQFFTADIENKMLTWDWTLEGKDIYGNEINDMQFYKILGNNPIQNQSKLIMDDSKRNLIAKEQVKRVHTAPLIKNEFVGLTTEEYVALSSETEKYFTDYTIKFITGEKSIDDEWDAYVQGYLDVGGEEIRQSLLEVYNERNGTDYVFGN